MSDERDDLRAAWRALTPEGGAGEDLAREDATTRASVDWLRAAWEHEVPKPAPELLARLEDRRAARRRRRLVPWLAACAAAAAILVALFVGERGPTPAAEPSRELAGTDEAAPGNEPPPRDEAPESDAAFGAPEGARVEGVSEGRVVLRSGPVRLYLAAGPPAAPHRMESTE